jgi:hypothetical protein
MRLSLQRSAGARALPITAPATLAATLPASFTATLAVAFVVALVVILSGCSSTTPVLDERFGHSLRELKTQQTLHPEAKLNLDPVAGIDGKAGVSAYQNYLKSFSSPQPRSEGSTISSAVGQR